MTTENTMTDAAPLTPEAVAEELVKSSTTAQIVEALVKYHYSEESLRQELAASDRRTVDFRTNYFSLSQKIEDFLKEHIKDDDPASVEELKELADELNIEMTKEVEVSFTVEVTATITVPIDFDAEDIEENDFDIRINYEGSHNDVECDDIEFNTSDFQSDDK